MPKRALIVPLVAALLATACGGDSTGSTVTSSTTSPDPSPTITPTTEALQPTFSYTIDPSLDGGGFEVVANDHAAYPEAILRKLLREIPHTN